MDAVPEGGEALVDGRPLLQARPRRPCALHTLAGKADLNSLFSHNLKMATDEKPPGEKLGSVSLGFRPGACHRGANVRGGIHLGPYLYIHYNEYNMNTYIYIGYTVALSTGI